MPFVIQDTRVVDESFHFQSRRLVLKASSAHHSHPVRLKLNQKESLEGALSQKVSQLSDETQSEKELLKILQDRAFFARYFTVDEVDQVVSGDWDDIADAVGVGDAAWMFGSEMFSAYASHLAIFASSFVWPLALGALVMARHYEQAVQRIETEKGRPPVDEEIAVIKQDTFVLGCKVMAAVVGWELGAEIAKVVCLNLFRAGVTAFAAHNPLAHLMAAALVGLFAGLGVALVNIVHESRKGHFSDSEMWKASGRLFLATFVAGAAWYGISLLPIAPISRHLTPLFHSAAKPVAVGLMSITKTLLTYIAVRFSFSDVYKLLGGEESKQKSYWSLGFFKHTATDLSSNLKLSPAPPAQYTPGQP